MYAKRYSRAACSAWATPCHRHPPSNGLGSNTSIAGRLQPRLEARAGAAGARPARRCCDTYDAERAPDRQADRAAREQVASRSSGRSSRRSACSRRPIPSRCGRNMEVRKETRRARRRGAREAAARDRAQELRVQRARGRARASATAPARSSPTARPSRSSTRDPELYYHPTTWPGARLPHALARAATGGRVSHARPRGQGPLRAADRDRRRARGSRRRAAVVGAHRRRDRRAS